MNPCGNKKGQNDYGWYLKIFGLDQGKQGGICFLNSSQVTWTRRLDLTAPTRFMGSRRLIREGLLIKAKSGRRLHGFLCSDIMVLMDASMKTLYRLVSFSIHLSNPHFTDFSQPIPLVHSQASVVSTHKGDSY
jgi:hypothetical protein